MRCSLNLHLRSAHEKPQQPNWFDSPTDPGLEDRVFHPCLKTGPTKNLGR